MQEIQAVAEKQDMLLGRRRVRMNRLFCLENVALCGLVLVPLELWMDKMLHHMSR